MAQVIGDMDMGDDSAERAALDDFLHDTGIGEELPFSLHGPNDDQSMHAGIMHAMELGPQPDVPLKFYGRR